MNIFVILGVACNMNEFHNRLTKEESEALKLVSFQNHGVMPCLGEKVQVTKFANLPVYRRLSVWKTLYI